MPEHFCGTGGWTGPLPGDPGDVFGLTATPAFGGIDVAWNLPGINPHAVAYTTVYRGLTATFAVALKLADWSGNRYFDQTPPGMPATTYYYWVQQVSVNGTLGALVGPASAIAQPTITQMMELLTGQLDDSVLGVALKAEIDRISLIDLSLADEIQARLDANDALQAVLTAVQTDVGEAVTLIQDETTTRTGENIAVVNSLNVLAAGTAGNTAAIVTEQEARVTAVSALASTVTTLSTAVDTNAAAMTTLQTTYTSDMEALVTDINELIATAGTGESSAALLAEALTRATEDTALASSITALETQVGDDLAAAILIEQTARTTAVNAVASSVTTLQATAGAGANLLHNSSFEFDANLNGLADSWTAYSLGTVTGAVRTVVDNTAIHGAKAQRCAWTSSSNGTGHRSGIYQAVAVPRGATRMAMTAYISGTVGARGVVYMNYYDSGNISIPGSSVTSPVTLTADFQRVEASSATIPGGAVTCRGYIWMDSFAGAAELLIDAAQLQPGVASVYAPSPDVAALQSEMTARIDADSALSSSITTAQTTLNGAIASAQTTLQTNIDVVDGNVVAVGARWTAVVDANGQIGGFGIHNNGMVGGVTAGFDVDNFYVGRTNANRIKPFIITDGIVYINEAAIGQLTANAIDGRGLIIRDPTTGNPVFAAGLPLTMGYIPGGAVNTNISVNASGQLIGAGGGQVTITGLGYTGALDAAARAPSLGVRMNATTFSNTSAGEAYLHGYDKNGAAADVDGFVFYNGAKVTIPKGYYINPDRAGVYYILFDVAGRNLWPSALGTAAASNITLAWKDTAGVWQYKAAATTGVVTLDADIIVIGALSFSASENIVSGAVWMDALSPYTVPEPGATVGAPAGTLIAGMAAVDIAQGYADFDNSNNRNVTIPVAPTIATNGSAVDHTLNEDGSANISLEWSWGGGDSSIDGFQVFMRADTVPGAYTILGTERDVQVFEVPAEKRGISFYGTPASRYYTFGVRAYRRVDADLGGIKQSAIVQPTRTTAPSEHPYRPSSVVAFSGDITGTLDNIPVGTVVLNAARGDEVYGDFNASNNQDTSAVIGPTIATDGSEVQHTLNTDGSANISFEWSWAGDEADIDGFEVYVRRAGSDADYTLNETNNSVVGYFMPAVKRAFILMGAPANRYYTFGVRAYRRVNKGVEPTGIKRSALKQTPGINTTPYRPSATVAFDGDVSGTIAGSAATVVAALATVGANLIPNPEFLNDAHGVASPAGWTLQSSSQQAFTAAQVTISSGNAAPWDASAPVLEANGLNPGSGETTGNIRWRMSRNIPVNLVTNYTLACWARRGSSPVLCRLGVACYDVNGASLGNVYISSLNNTQPGTEWARYEGVLGPLGVAFPPDTVSVQVLWVGSNNTVLGDSYGISKATRFTFNEGRVATPSSAPYNRSVLSDVNQITSLNISSYIAAAAIEWAYIGDLVIQTDGAISSGQTGYNIGTGWWLGFSDGVPKFSIGDQFGAHLRWTAASGLVIKNATVDTPVFDAYSASTGTAITTSGANGQRTYGSRTAAGSGGRTPYAYSWAIVHNDPYESGTSYMRISAGATTATATFVGSGTNIQHFGTAICTVTDANGRSTRVSVGIDATHGTPGPLP